MSEAEIETIISIVAIAISMFTIGLNIGFDMGMSAGLRRPRERDRDADQHRPRVLGGYRGVIGEPGDPPAGGSMGKRRTAS